MLLTSDAAIYASAFSLGDFNSIFGRGQVGIKQLGEGPGPPKSTECICSPVDKAHAEAVPLHAAGPRHLIQALAKIAASIVWNMLCKIQQALPFNFVQTCGTKSYQLRYLEESRFEFELYEPQLESY